MVVWRSCGRVEGCLELRRCGHHLLEGWKILLHADRLQAYSRVHLLEGEKASLLGDLEERIHGSGRRQDERPEEIGNPGGGMTQILEDRRAVWGGDVTSERGEDIVIHLFLAEMSQGLDQGAALASRSGHVARGGMKE